MQVACRTRADIHPSEPWYLSILYVQATYMTCISGTWGDNYKQEPLPPSKRGDKCLQDDSPVSRECWNKCADAGPNLFASSFRTLRWSSLGSTAFDGFKPFSNLITPSGITTIISMKGAELQVNGTSLYSILFSSNGKRKKQKVFLTWSEGHREGRGGW